jgi:hypothetical protein
MQVHALPQHAAVLRALRWPPELLISKNTALSNANAYIAAKPGSIHTLLKIVRWGSADAQAFPARLQRIGAAGVVTLPDAMGVLLPLAQPGSAQVRLRLVIVPGAGPA